MSKQKRGLPALALGIVLILSVSAGAWTMAQHQRPKHGPGEGGGHGMMLRHIMGELDLSEDQKLVVHDGILTRHEALEPVMASLGEAKGDVGRAIHATEFDETAIRDAAARVGQLEADLAVGRAEMLHELRAILTPEQQEKLELMLGTMMAGHGAHGMGHGSMRSPRGGDAESERGSQR